LEKVLVINDDADDIKAVMERLPEGIKVEGASQFQAGFMLKNPGYFDLIVLDNDANDRQESKGAETLKTIRKKAPDVPIIYTSFQPGWVDRAVSETEGVLVVPTAGLMDHLAEAYGIEPLPPKEKAAGEQPVNIILTYNSVDGYSPGVHCDGRLLVVSYDKYANERAKAIVENALDELYGQFDWRSDRDIIRNVFVYDGVRGEDAPGFAATALGHDIRMRVNMLACPCDWERKQNLASSMYVNLYKVRCRGTRELGAIADVIAGITRQNTEEHLPMPRERILAPAERFGI
jgi:CheY-like chemotaxis protein